MVEFFHDGAWRVVAPSDDGFVWRTPNGEIARIEDITSDAEVYDQIYDFRSDFPYTFEGYNYINWGKLPGPVVSLLRRMLSEQQFDNATTPYLYDAPRELFLIASSMLALGALLPLVFLRRYYR